MHPIFVQIITTFPTHILLFIPAYYFYILHSFIFKLVMKAPLWYNCSES